MWGCGVLNVAVKTGVQRPQIRYDLISPVLLIMHWLRISEHVAFRLAVLVFRCRNITASEYLARDLQWTVDDDSGSVYNLRRVTNWLSGAPD